MKTFTFAGVSRQNGVLAFRVANDVGRITHLRKVGHTDVEMRVLSKASTKEQAAEELLAMDFAAGRSEIQAVLKAVANKSATVRVRTKKAKVVSQEPTLTIAEANARVMASVREVTPEEAVRRMVVKAVKQRRSRKETV